MKIRICEKNRMKITHALQVVNGDALRHTTSNYSEIATAADNGEKRMARLGIQKTKRAGARIVFLSGGSVPRCYKYARKCTLAKLERGASGWFLVLADRVELWPNQDGGEYLHITPAQDAAAVSSLRQKYIIQQEVAK